MVSYEELSEILALELTPREKNEFEVIDILDKNERFTSVCKTKKPRVLSIFARFDINFPENALEFNRGATYKNKLQSMFQIVYKMLPCFE